MLLKTVALTFEFLNLEMTSSNQTLHALKGSLSVLQLPPAFKQEEACQQTSVHQEKKTASYAGHAPATKEVEPGHRGDVQGGPPGHAPTEPPAGPVSAAAGAHDEPFGEDDPASLHHVSVMGTEWGERSRETVKCGDYGHCLTYSLVKGTIVFCLGFQPAISLTHISADAMNNAGTLVSTVKTSFFISEIAVSDRS